MDIILVSLVRREITIFFFVDFSWRTTTTKDYKTFNNQIKGAAVDIFVIELHSYQFIQQLNYLIASKIRSIKKEQ